MLVIITVYCCGFQHYNIVLRHSIYMMLSATPLLVLLEDIKHAGFLETYFYFPGVIVAGDKNIERTDFEYLLSHQYIKEANVDSSVKYYSLTSKAELILSDSIPTTGKERTLFAGN